MRPLLAIARTTIAEARQDRVTLVFLVLALVLIPFTAFLPSLDAGDGGVADATASRIGSGQLVTQNRDDLGGLAQTGSRENVFRKFSLIVSLVFGGLTAVFLSAKSIPRDFDTRLYLTIVSKPVRKWQYFAGKLVGIAAVIVITLALHGAISVALLYAACDPEQLRPVGRIYPATVAVSGAAEVRTERQKGEPVQFLIGDAAAGIQSGKPVRAVFTFEGLDRAAFGDSLVIESNLALAATAMRTRVDVPLRWRTIDAQSGVPSVVDRKSRPGSRTLIAMSSAGIDPQGRMQVLVDRLDNDFTIGVSPTRVWIREAPGSFMWTFTRMQLLVALQLLVIAAAVLSVSTCTNELTGIMAGVLLLAAANLVGFVTYTLTRAEEREAAAADRAAAAPRLPGEAPVAPPASQTAGKATRDRLLTLCSLVPDFDRYDLPRHYEEGYTVPAALAWPLVGYNLLYVAAFALPGLVLLNLREAAA